MEEDFTTQSLFSYMPRDLGVKFKKFLRVKVSSWLQVEKYLNKYNGLYDLYISVYDYNLHVDKIVLDLDSLNVEEAYSDLLVLVDYLRSERLPYYVLFSGFKGFHVYVLFKPWKAPNRETFKIVLRSFLSYLLSGVSLKTLDKQSLMNSLNPTGLIRIPNTQHSKTHKYCTYLPHDFYCKMSLEEIIEYSNEPHFVYKTSGKLYDIREFINLSCEDSYELLVSEVPSFPKHSLPKEFKATVKMLKHIVRPCVLYFSCTSEPDHFIRTTLACELAWLDYSPEEITKLIENLGWSDFNREITLYHTRKIWQKVHSKTEKLYPASCRTLRKLGYCLKDKFNCEDWNYWWAGW